MSEYTQALKGFWHVNGSVPTSQARALDAWTAATHDLLAEVAGSYHATITETEFAERLTDRSGIATSRPPEVWLAKLFVPVVRDCLFRGEPLLPALVVDDSGRVGEAYLTTARAAGAVIGREPAAEQRHAAETRLECYRWAGSAPADGGVPAALPGRAPTRRRSSPGSAGGTRPQPARTPRESKATTPKRTREERPPAICTSCFMALPATGVCDNCD